MGSNASSRPRRPPRPIQPSDNHTNQAKPTRRTDAADADENRAAEPIPREIEAGRDLPTFAEIKNHWPATVDVPTAGAVFGLSRSHSYELVKRGQFPVTVIQIGSRYRVLTESIIRAVSEPPPDPTV